MIKIYICVAILFMFADIIAIGFIIRKNRRAKEKILREIENDTRGIDSKMKQLSFEIEYSKSVLTILREIISGYVVVRFKEFEDSKKNIAKITRINIIKLIDDICTDLHGMGVGSINISTEHLLFNTSFINKYIIDIVVYQVKLLMEKSEKEYEEI